MKYIIICWSLMVFQLGQAQKTQSALEGFNLMEQALQRSINNQLQNAFDEFQYDSYENFKITGDPEAITGPGYKKTELRKTLKQTRVFFAEKTSTYLYDDKYGLKEQITAAYMPGFKEPVYPIFNIKFQSNSAYDAPYVIFDGSYINPMSKRGLESYNYDVVKDTILQGRLTTLLSFNPIDIKDPTTMQGAIYLDKETLAIARAIFKKTGDLNVEAIHDYSYQQDKNIWFNSKRSLFIKKEKDKKELELFGARLEVGTETDEKKSSTNEDLYVFLQAINYDFKNQLVTPYGRRGLVREVLDDAVLKDNKYWLPYRQKAENTNSEFATYKGIDSIVDATNVTGKLETLDKFKIGYYPIGIFDVDLKYLVKYNNYEAFRLGIGGTTNEKLSENWRVGGYLAYGTQDQKFKYGINAGYLINKDKNTWINIFRTDDITEFAAESFLTDARVYSLFEPRLVNIPTFYKFKDFGTSLQQRLFPSLISEISLSRKQISQITDYQFQPSGTSAMSDYTLSELKVGARWSPYSEYLRTPRGYQESITGFPVFSAQVTKGFDNFLDSDYDYLKLSGKASYKKIHLDNSNTEISFEGHFASGEVPLTHLFHAYPNAPNKEKVLQRFSVAGRRSFETMYFNEFFSDKIAIGQIKHEFATLNITSFLQPELVVISRFAIGNLDNKEEHQGIDFNTLEHGYLESGFELNKILYGFGISAAYRYGAYHLPQFEDNLSLKFTFYLEL